MNEDEETYEDEEDSAEETSEGDLDLLEQFSEHQNIAAELETEELSKISQRCVKGYTIDCNSRSEWLKQNEEAMDLAMQITKERTYPWPKAANVVYPLLTEAAIQFAARAYPALVDGRQVVKGVVVGADMGTQAIDPRTQQPAMRPAVGPDMQPQPNPGTGQPALEPVWEIPPGAKRARAERIGDHMSWQLLYEMEEWEEETYRLLMMLPIVGCVFRKTFFDTVENRNKSIIATAANVVINYTARSLETAPRISEIVKYYPYQIEEMQRDGTFVENTYGVDGDDVDAPHEFIEQHCRIDLDGDGYDEPYVVTIHKKTNHVARIIARYTMDDVMVDQETGRVLRINPVQFYTKYDFLPNPDGGVYGIGFGKLLGPINASVNSTLNMLLDAGHLANVQGGFIGRGLSMRGGAARFRPGEWKQINAPGGAIRDALVPLQFPGPSDTLFNLLGLLIEAGEKIGSVKDVLTGDNSLASTMQPTTLLALIEQGMKVYTAVYKGIYKSASREYKKLYDLNAENQDELGPYQVGDEWRQIQPGDYDDDASVAPVSDPTMVSDMQRLMRANFLQSYQDDPYCDGTEIRRRVFEAAAIANSEQLITGPPQPQPDPLVELRKAEIENQRAELMTKEMSERAKRIETLAKAVKALAEADATEGNKDMEWERGQLEILKGLASMFVGDEQAQAQAQAGSQPSAGPPPLGGQPPSGVPLLSEPQEM